MKNMQAKVITPKGPTEECLIDKGVSRGDVMSTTLFNMALDRVNASNITTM